jgi:hypothetical protein
MLISELKRSTVCWLVQGRRRRKAGEEEKNPPLPLTPPTPNFVYIKQNKTETKTAGSSFSLPENRARQTEKNNREKKKDWGVGA